MAVHSEPDGSNGVHRTIAGNRSLLDSKQVSAARRFSTSRTNQSHSKNRVNGILLNRLALDRLLQLLDKWEKLLEINLLLDSDESINSRGNSDITEANHGVDTVSSILPGLFYTSI